MDLKFLRYTSSLILIPAGLFHLSRSLFEWELIVAGWTVPFNWSFALGFIVLYLGLRLLPRWRRSKL
jgi:hypothetical protein